MRAHGKTSASRGSSVQSGTRWAALPAVHSHHVQLGWGLAAAEHPRRQSEAVVAAAAVCGVGNLGSRFFEQGVGGLREDLSDPFICPIAHSFFLCSLSREGGGRDLNKNKNVAAVVAKLDAPIEVSS